MSEPTYEVWHFDGKRPELLSGGHPDKGVCRRVWRNSTHAVIARDGLVLEPKPSCDSKTARALASAVAEAHRAAPGAAPVAAFVGPVLGDGKRALEMDTRGKGSRLAALATAAQARAGVLAPITSEPAASKPTSRPRPSKPAPVARATKAPAVDAPVSDLLAVVRRQRSTIDALGGIDQAERVAATAARVGGPEALVQLVDEIARAVA